MTKTRFYKYAAVLSFATLLWNACTKENEYKKYIEGGERIYAGRPDSLHAYSGKNRVMLWWLLIADPKIAKSLIRWNGGRDSLTVPVERTGGIDTIKVTIENLPEDIYSFTVINYDKFGNASVPRTVAGRTYGPRYESSLFNRGILAVNKMYKGPEEFDVMIIWNSYTPADKDIMVSSELSYTDRYGNDHVETIDARSDQPTILPDFKAGEAFSYRSRYMPDSLAIDTFYSRLSTVRVE